MRLQSRESKPLFVPETAANLRVVLLVGLSLALMTLDHRFHQLEQLRNLLSTAIYPLQYAIQVPFSAWENFGRNLASHGELAEENHRLQQKQMLLNAQLQKLASLEAENRRLRMLLESSVNLQERALIAELISVDFDPYRHQILLNKGQRDGVDIGQPLLDQQGIIGQVIHVNEFSSTAILITDPSHSLPVQVNRNGLRTLAMGSGKFQELELPYIPNNDDIQEGDLLITSGMGGRFPRGYPVAVVTKVAFDAGSPFARVTARPTAQLDRVREVLLVISTPKPDADSLRVGPYKAP